LDEREGFTPGYKFNDWELRGVPLRIEIGPKDVAKGSAALARRDVPGKDGKSFIPLTELSQKVKEMLEIIQESLYAKALAFRQDHTHEPQDFEELLEVIKNGWALAWWCGDGACEARIKEEAKATARCIPFEQPGGEGRCISCGRESNTKVIFARAY
jgi:prolyl-tRNA synthetase